MRIDIKIDREFEGSFENFDEAIKHLEKQKERQLKKQKDTRLFTFISTHSFNEIKNFVLESRCAKCVYEGTCKSLDFGDCKNYKRDPPDGGYYG